MAETPVAPGGILSIARKVWFFIPSFARFEPIARTGTGMILFEICADLFYAKVEPAFSLAKGRLASPRSPVRQSEDMAAKGYLKTAGEYIAFSSSLPGVAISPELEDLAREIHGERHGLVFGGL